MQQFAVPVHQVRAIRNLFPDPKAFGGRFQSIRVTVGRAEELCNLGGPRREIGGPGLHRGKHREKCSTLHQDSPRIRTKLRSMAARLGTPASPISSANSVRNSSMTRSTPGCPNAASPYKYGRAMQMA